MIAFPLFATLVALACAAFLGRDAIERPRPERIIWALAFLVFAVAAGSEVAGSALGWSAPLTRVYYLSGAVLVVGFLALGELYLLFPNRMPAVTPGLTLLVVAVAISTVWSAPVDAASLRTHGWAAIERGPALVALAATINAGGTIVLVAGALYSWWRLRGATVTKQRALGCLLIAAGTIVVAAGGTLTRFGHREYLYFAMALGIAIIFAGVMLTRGKPRARFRSSGEAAIADLDGSPRRARLIPLPSGHAQSGGMAQATPGIEFIITNLLLLQDDQLEAACRNWSASAIDGNELTRDQAKQVWALRLALPEQFRGRFDGLPMRLQAQLAELEREVWSAAAASGDGRRRA
jgi:hypothetical protein